MRYARLAALFAVTAALALAAGCGDDDEGGGSGDAVKAPEGPKAMTRLGDGEGKGWVWSTRRALNLARFPVTAELRAFWQQLDRAAFVEAAGGPYEIDDFAYEEIDPEIYGNTAVLVSRYSQVARLDGRDLTHRMHVTDIWTRREARWQIVRRHATIAD